MASDGNTRKVPVLNDASEEGEVLANQGSTATDRDLQGVNEREMKSQFISSKKVIAHLGFNMDTDFDTDALIRWMLDRRLDAADNRQLTTGTGTGDFEAFRGAVTDAAVGVTLASKTAITADEFLSLPETVDVAYMVGEGSPAGLNPIGGSGTYRGYMGNQVDLAGLRRMTSSQDGHFQFRPGPAAMMLRGGMMGEIEGIPLRINNHMAKLSDGAGSARVGMYGNFGYMLDWRVNFRINVRFFDSGTISTLASHHIAFIRKGNRYIGGFPNTAQDTCEAVKVIQAAA